MDTIFSNNSFKPAVNIQRGAYNTYPHRVLISEIISRVFVLIAELHGLQHSRRLFPISFSAKHSLDRRTTSRDTDRVYDGRRRIGRRWLVGCAALSTALFASMFWPLQYNEWPVSFSLPRLLSARPHVSRHPHRQRSPDRCRLLVGLWPHRRQPSDAEPQGRACHPSRRTRCRRKVA